MNAISQALNDVKKYLEIDEIKRVKIDYENAFEEESEKSIDLFLESKKYGLIVTITRVPVKEEK